MKRYVKNITHKAFLKLGYEVRRTDYAYRNLPVELSDEDKCNIRYIVDHQLTMTSVQRLVNTLKTCKYVVANNIPGDFVECGVWRGGHAILAKRVFEGLGSDRKVWMFDTFEGMTAPTTLDIKINAKQDASVKYNQSLKDDHCDWAYASFHEVKDNCQKSGIDMAGLEFVQGDVCQTLKNEERLPDQICALRLDTDWYESTKMELEVLYPRISSLGALIIDDYGEWHGARKAVDEYFSKKDYKPLFNRIDQTGVASLKP